MRLVKHLLIVFLMTLLPYWVISPFFELYMLPTKASHINQVVRTAADMTIEQLLATDDFMSTDQGLLTDTVNSQLLMLANTGSFMSKVGLHEHVFGTTNKAVIFNSLYNNNNFRNFAMSVVNVKTPLHYYNPTMTGFSVYDVPSLLWMGSSILGNIDPALFITKNGVPVGDSIGNGILAFYGLETLILETNEGDYAGYKTPVNQGVTHFDETLLNTLFVNNMDVLMRSKYKDISVGLGVSDNGFHSDLLEPVRAEYNHLNPVNNGIFTLIRGSQRSNINSVTMFNGTGCDIEYKVVDMYDYNNEDLLVYVFGSFKNGLPTKVDYLRAIGSTNINPDTGLPYPERNIVIAKITFKADILVPYSTPIMKFLSQYGRPESQGFLDRGSNTFEYTTFFAVTP